MKTEILDEIQDERIDNKKLIYRVIRLSIGTILIYFLIELLRGYLPENLLNENGVQIKTFGLIIIGVIVFISVIIPTYLNGFKPKLTILEIVAYSGLIIFGIELAFKIVQNFIVLKKGLNMDYLQIMKSALIISAIGISIANIRIHKLRDKKILWPTLILIGCWFVIGVLLKK